MSFLKGVMAAFGGAEATRAGAVTGAKVAQLPAAQRMRYELSRQRFHLDSREPVTFVVLHDVLRCSAALQPLTAAVTRMPTGGACPVLPLDMYLPDLRLHGRTGGDAPLSVLGCASDVLRFTDNVVESRGQVHLVGYGFGARVALAAALASPDAYASVSAVDGAVSAAETRALLDAVTKVAVEKGMTAAQAEAALRELVPDEATRLELVTSFEAASTATGGAARWRSDVARLSQQLDDAFAWPAKELAGLQFARPSASIHCCAARAGLPEGVDAAAFPSMSQVSVADTREHAAVLDAVLRLTDLHGSVEKVLPEATSVDGAY